MKKRLALIIASVLILQTIIPVGASPMEWAYPDTRETAWSSPDLNDAWSASDLEEAGSSDFTALDYSVSDNWLSYGEGEDKAADVFWVCPSISGNGVENIPDDEYSRALMLNELNSEKGIYADVCSVYAPFYRQMGLRGYITEYYSEWLDNAYTDISAAFAYYIQQSDPERPLILAGFSQGTDMCYRLMMEYFGGDSETAQNLRERLVAVYALGWAMTDEMVSAYPQMVPAVSSNDTGVVVSYECEDDRLPTSSGNLIIREGEKMIAINPLNWRADSEKADRTLNLGALVRNAEGKYVPVPGYCGAYIDPERGCLKVTDLEDEFRYLPLLGEASLHLYDYLFFYVNLRKNVSDRMQAYSDSHPESCSYNNVNSTITTADSSITFTYKEYVEYGGKKVKADTAPEITGLSLNGETVSDASAVLNLEKTKVVYKNSRAAYVSGNRIIADGSWVDTSSDYSGMSDKRPAFSLRLKAGKGASKEQKKAVAQLNKALKNKENLQYFNIVPITLDTARLEIKTDGDKIKSVYDKELKKKMKYDQNGRKDYTYSGSADGFSITGTWNYTGTVQYTSAS